MNWEPCVSCARLLKCADTTETMLVDGLGCALHEPTHDGVTRARLRFLGEFGPGAILSPNEGNHMPAKVLLRKLCIALKLIERGGAAFTLTEGQLVEKLTPKYPNIGSMTNEEVEALIADVEGGGSGAAPAATPAAAAEPAPAEKKPRGRPASRVAAQEEPPAEERKEEVADEPAPRRAPASRTAARTAPAESDAGRRAPAPRSAAAPAPASQAGGEDEVIAMLRVIGTAGDARDEEIKALRAQVKALTEAVSGVTEALAEVGAQVNVLSAHAAWLYNDGRPPADHISNLSDVDWAD